MAGRVRKRRLEAEHEENMKDHSDHCGGVVAGVVLLSAALVMAGIVAGLLVILLR
jgi:hypothetical protein